MRPDLELQVDLAAGPPIRSPSFRSVLLDAAAAATRPPPASPVLGGATARRRSGRTGRRGTTTITAAVGAKVIRVKAK